MRAVDIIAEYKQKQDLYYQFTENVKEILDEILSDRAEINIHSVRARTKSVDSLAEKVRRPGKDYDELSEIKDLTAVRIVTYFADEIDVVGKILENRLTVDPRHSIDKRKGFDYHEFGYNSLHKVAKLKSGHLSGDKFDKFKGLYFEIQIRTILQHAWAEIEHDLGYKYKEEIPDSINRRFARLSALLEVADDEFLSLRDDLEEYEIEIQNQIRESPEQVGINKLTLQQFMEVDKTMQNLTSYIDEWSQNLPRKTTGKDFFLGDVVRGMKIIGVNNIRVLQNVLADYENLIKNSFDLVFARDKELPGWSPSMILFALILIYGAVNYQGSKLQNFYDKLGFRPRENFERKVRQQAAK